MEPIPLPSLPVPLFGALALAGLLFLAHLRGNAARTLLVLIGMSAVQLLVVALAQHWHWPLARAIQPVSAVAIPPLAWVAFRRGAVRGRAWMRDLPHAAGPIGVAALAALAPAALDVAVPALFAGYGLAIALAVRAGADGVPLARLEHGGGTARMWRLVGAALVVSAASDVAIALALAADRPVLAGWVLSVAATGYLLAIGAIALTPALDPDRQEPETEPEPQDANSAGRRPDPGEDDAIMARLDRLMAERAPHLDPDLTLTRLARRLGVPAKALSAAVNRTTGENVSRFVNRHRVEAACRRLAAGDTVTAAMLASGFATKSNFNREFLRVVGETPSARRAALDGGGAKRDQDRAKTA